MKNGFFISMEGPDGAGKSTQIAEIEKYFLNLGKEVLITREPGGTRIGEKIRALILDVENKEMTPMTELMLYAAARAEHVAEVIKPAITAGKVVICDRYIDSSMAYQGYGRGLKEAVKAINSYGMEGVLPDLTFLIRLSPEIGLSRIEKSSHDRMEREDIDFHKAVFLGYLDIEKDNPGRIFGIDGSREVSAITEEIYHILDRIVEEKRDAE